MLYFQVFRHNHRIGTLAVNEIGHIFMDNDHNILNSSGPIPEWHISDDGQNVRWLIHRDGLRLLRINRR